MPSLDTNVVLRIFLQDNPAQAAKALSAVRAYDKVALADTCVQEAVFVLEKVYELPRAKVAEFLHSLLENQHLNFNRPVVVKALPNYLSYPALSFCDCCLAAYAILTNSVPLLTFDKKLANQLANVDLIV